MAEAITIARPYAEAAFKIARQHGALDAWSKMLGFIAEVSADARMRAVIADPNRSAADLKQLFHAIAGDRLDGLARNFVSVLVDNHRAGLLPEIAAHFEDLKRGAEGVLEARIASAFPLAGPQLAALVSNLEAKYQRRIQATVVVAPELIGGVKIEVGDQVLDASVRGRLDAMAVTLTQ